MPIFRNRAALKVTRNIKIFFSLEMGITRGMTPAEQLAKKNEEIVTLREELARADKNREVATSRKEPVRPRSGTWRPGLTERGAPVFFVVGHQKSGTTWTMKMLDAHPEILCQGEGRPFGRGFRQDYEEGTQTGYPPVSLSAAIASKDLKTWISRSVWSKNDNQRKHLDNLTRLSIEYFLTQQLLKTGKRMVGDKTVLLNPNIIQEIAAIYPNAKVIHVIRDGRDVAVSTVHHIWNQAEDRGGTVKMTPVQKAKREAYRKDPRQLVESGEGIFSKGGLGHFAKTWSANVDKSAKDGSALLGNNYTEVRYEDLLEKPEEELGRLLEFLGADAEGTTVAHCVNAASFERLSEGRKRGEEAASFYRKGISGDWRNVFTEQNKRVFKEEAGDLLIRLGYERNNA